jgi:hypothetical protein
MSKFLKFPTEFTNSNWTCVASNNNTSSPIWVALADSGPFRVARSTDGVNWTIIQGLTASVVNKTWTSVAFGNGRFVAVANSGTNRMMTSTDGITWTEVTAAAGGYVDGIFTGIAWNGTVFAVVSSGVATNAVYHSTTGTSGYTGTNAATAQAWNGIAWNGAGNTWVIVASDGTTTAQINRNANATPTGTWAAATTAATTSTWQSVVARGTTFVAVSNSGSNRAYVSTDNGVTWTSNAGISASVSWKSLASNGTNIVAVGQDGAQSVRIATSADGTTWTAAAGATTNNNSNIWNGVASLGTSNSYVAVSRSGGQRRILFTSDTFATSTICNDSYPPTRISSPAYLNVESVISAQEGSSASTTLVLNILTPSASFDVVTLTFGEDLTGATHEVILDAIVDANSAVSSPEGALTVSLPENRNVTLSFA